MVMLVVLPADRLLGVVDTNNWLAAAGVTMRLPVPEIVAEASLAMMVCVPAASSVAVTVARPPVNVTTGFAEKLAPLSESDSVTESLKPVTALLY